MHFWANFQNCKWPNIKHAIHKSGHTAYFIFDWKSQFGKYLPFRVLASESFFLCNSSFCIFDAFCIIRFREMKYGWDTNPRYLVSTSICPTNCATTIVLRFTLNNLRHKLSPTKHWPRALCSIHSLSGQILSLLFLLSWLSLVRQSMFIQNDFVECFKQAKVISIKIIMPLRTPFDDKELDNGSPLVEQKHCYC